MLMLGVKNVEYSAFYACFGLSSVEFGRDLETIGESAFDQCNSLRNIKMPNVLRIGLRAFQDCAVTELDLPLGLEVVEGQAFGGCQSLTRVSMPLKGGMIQGGAFVGCSRLVRIDLIGGIHDFVSSLHLEEWRNTMKAEISRINEDLPLINVGEVDKTRVIQEWMQSVLDRAEHYKGEHYALLKEGMTILELAVWGAKIVEAEKERDDNDDDKSTAATSSVSLEENLSEKLKIDNDGDNDGDDEWRWRFRQQQRGKSLANVVIHNVLPYLMCTKLDHE
ncbi:leucine-rich repeat domain-containing protein [Skeletonema marinoi]|nr:leucine-rich repeat domain-containing protein [Skeletonema marinoi]